MDPLTFLDTLIPSPYKLEPLRPFVSLLGLLIIACFVLGFIGSTYRYFLRGGKNLKKYGEYAIVTGATDGIGRAMAMELARKGLHIVIISRTQSKLDETAKEITAKYPNIKVVSIAIDFSKFDEAARQKVVDGIKGLDIGVLVNNVGVSYDFTTYFDEIEDQRVKDLISLNIDSTTWMTRIVLPDMKKKRRGAIVNVASVAGITISPLLAQYGGAKSYVASFSKALHYELKPFGIDVQCQVPLYVVSKLSKFKKPSWPFIPSASSFARTAVAAIGYDALISPFWSHALQIYALSLLPESIQASIVRSMHVGIRAKALKKQKAEEGKKGN